MQTDRDVLSALSDQFGNELVGINEFATLVGFDRSTAAQVRAERKRNVTGFPPVVSESGRSFLHRLGDLIEWTEHSRYQKFVSIRQHEITAWRLSRRMLGIVEAIGVFDARRLLAALALTHSDDPTKTQAITRLQRSPDALVQELIDDIPLHDVHDDVELVDMEMTGADRTAQLVDQAIVALGEHQPGVPHRTSDLLASLTAVVLDAHDGDTVYEPTAGECEILLRVVELARLRGDRLGHVAGSDIHTESTLIGRARVALAGQNVAIGDGVAPGTVDRLIIDAGGPVNRRDVASWVRLLHRDGRVVVITRINGRDDDLLAELWPSAIVFPPQRANTAQGSLALWVSEPFRERPQETLVLDLRAPVAVDVTSSEAPLDALRRLGLTYGSEPETAPWYLALVEALPQSLVVTEIGQSELTERLEHAVTGTLQHPSDVIESNRDYALMIAQELERLIGGRATPTEPGLLQRPHESPDGVLRGRTTDESRRIVARLVDTLARDEART